MRVKYASVRKAANLFFETRMKPLAEPKWKLEDPLIRGKDQNIPRGIQDGRTNLAVLQVFLYLLEHVRREAMVQVAGDVLPNMFAL
jgi:hypothetical protein